MKKIVAITYAASIAALYEVQINGSDDRLLIAALAVAIVTTATAVARALVRVRHN
jgi:hypothetical protein